MYIILKVNLVFSKDIKVGFFLSNSMSFENHEVSNEFESFLTAFWYWMRISLRTFFKYFFLQLFKIRIKSWKEVTKTVGPSTFKNRHLVFSLYILKLVKQVFIIHFVMNMWFLSPNNIRNSSSTFWKKQIGS